MGGALMDWLSDKLDNILLWILELVKNIFETLWDWVTDLLLTLLDLFLSAIVFLFSAIPAPDFITSGLSSTVGNFPALLLYIMQHSGVTAALGIMSTGLLFRLIRKAVTLFQW